MLRTTDKILFILSRFRAGWSLGPAGTAKETGPLNAHGGSARRSFFLS